MIRYVYLASSYCDISIIRYVLTPLPLSATLDLLSFLNLDVLLSDCMLCWYLKLSNFCHLESVLSSVITDFLSISVWIFCNTCIGQLSFCCQNCTISYHLQFPFISDCRSHFLLIFRWPRHSSIRAHASLTARSVFMKGKLLKYLQFHFTWRQTWFCFCPWLH